MNITYIGKIKTPFKSLVEMPIQSSMAKGIRGEIILNQEFVAGLKDIEGFSHIILLYHFHKATDYSLEVVPFMDSKPHGVFATRAPLRPNPIGFSIVRLLYRAENILYIDDVDMVNDTPLIDIKPYIPYFDHRKATRVGWFQNKHPEKSRKSDNRFI